MRNITQYGALFSAAGATLNFDTRTAQLEVITMSQPMAVMSAIADIEHYEDTANYTDGIAAVFHADYVDNQPNPFSSEQRDNVLNELGIKASDKFIAQYLATQKTNRSWHTSATPNGCSYFGDECTSRGSVDVPGKRGRKSTRLPTDFHRMSSTGTVAREQLVTKGIEGLYKAALSHEDRIVSTGGNISIDRLKDLSDDKLHEILEAIEQIKSGRT